MDTKRISNVIRKEWEVMFKSVNNTLFITLIPLIMIGQLMAFLYFGGGFISEDILNELLSQTIFQHAISNMESLLPQSQGKLPINEVFQLLILIQFPYYLLLIPTMVAISFATFNILEEKQTGTLEPLLATPVRTWELLFGKALAGAIPSIIISWFYTGLCVIAISILMPFKTVSFYLVREPFISIWLITLLLMVPAISILSFMLGVISSSKASDAKSAQNISLFIILPVLAIIGTQITGLVIFTRGLLLLLTLAIGVIDYLVLRLAIKIFQRESILVRWR